MVDIDIELRERSFLYLWAKSVRGFDESQHCQSCLVGGWKKSWSNDANFYDPPFFLRGQYRGRDPFIYLCGVTHGYRWAENLHIAARVEPGAEIVHEDPRIHVIIRGAVQVPIPPLPEGVRYPRQFATCRNFQFGYHYLRDPERKRQAGLF